MAVYAELDVWILPDEVLQIVQEYVLAQGCAHADSYVTDSKLLVILQIFLTHIQRVKCPLNIFIENLSLFSQSYPSGTSVKKRSAEFFFKFGNSLAYRGLTDVELICGLADVAGFGNCMKNNVIVQITYHDIPPGYNNYSFYIL